MARETSVPIQRLALEQDLCRIGGALVQIMPDGRVPPERAAANGRERDAGGGVKE